MTWFHPKTLLDKTYEVGIIIKAIDGFFQLSASLLLLFMTPAAFHTLMSHLGHSGETLSAHKTTAILFLFSHGAVKLFLAICLLLNKHWAYPWALAALGVFTIYQMYHIIQRPSVGLAIITIINIGIMYLIYREWNVQKAAQRSSTTDTNH